MKKLIILFILFFPCLIFAQAKIFPSAILKTIEGEAINIQDVIKHKPTVIIFWATWAKESSFRLLDFAHEQQERWKNDYNIQIIGISNDWERQLDRVKGAVNKHTNGNWWEVQILFDFQATFFKELCKDCGIPYTFFVNSKGEIVDFQSGFSGGEKEKADFAEKVKSISNKQ